ncbi:hypothetical protein [Caulobacter sp. BE254]|uniref:hypothetical protein n=1 Tax=Caulobacter sp. BE254 TaxID=2817720 RepID=UPI002857C955|nr:hypothetical protein [Caulobacter sp. BE254]MDR7114671.1 hypothetical protein [Caulobacter sp. BE254]
MITKGELLDRVLSSSEDSDVWNISDADLDRISGAGGPPRQGAFIEIGGPGTFLETPTFHDTDPFIEWIG